MLKRLLLLCSVLLFVPFSTFAISLADIRSNEDRYIYQGATASKADFYFDRQSPKIVRNEHPFYEIECVLYCYDDTHGIAEYPVRFLYDYNRSELSLYNETKAELSRYQSDRQTEIMKAARAKQKEDCGIWMTAKKSQLYQKDGTYLGEEELREIGKLHCNSLLARMADIAFRDCFGATFLFSQFAPESEAESLALFLSKKSSKSATAN